MLKKIILSSMLLLSSHVYADNLNKIFDIELGSQVDETKSNFIRNDSLNNFALYKIDFKGFKGVLVYYTPTTHKIYNIIAIKESDSSCESEAELIAGILGKRYGELTKHERIVETAYLLKSENKSLIVGCNGVIDKKISIYLIDNDLADLQKKEELEIESAKEAKNF
jgi:hypothetical protein